MKHRFPVRRLLLLGLGACSSGQAPPALEVDTIPLRELEPVATEAHFTTVRDMIISGGFIWVLDGAPPFLTRVNPETGEALRIGAEGRGPGEFLDPWAIQPALDTDAAHVLVWDFGTFRVSEFDPRGKLVSSDRLSEGGTVRARSDIREVSYGDPFRVRAAGQDFLLAQYPGRIDHTADLLMGTLVATDRVMEAGEPLESLRDHVMDDSSRFREWAPLPLWDSCDGVIAIWSPALGGVGWFDTTGEPRGQRNLARSAEPIRLDDIQKYLQWMARLELGPDYEKAGLDYETLARQSRDRFPRHRPGATDLRCESLHLAWIRLFDTTYDPLGRGTDWLRIPASGSTAEFRFPPGFTPFSFQDGEVWGSLDVSGGHHQILAGWRMGRKNPPDNSQTSPDSHLPSPGG